MKRFIFDVDGTLLHGNFYDEDVLFRAVLRDKAEEFIKNKINYLYEYEDLYQKYDIRLLSHFLSEKIDMKIDSNIIKAWIHLNSNMSDMIDETAIHLLEYAKANNIPCSVLTNFFSETQISRLKRANLYDYFDIIIGGDICMKPNRESYVLASGGMDLSDCIMIGDSFDKDVLAPLQYGMKAVYYSEEDSTFEHKNYQKVNKLSEITKLY